MIENKKASILLILKTLEEYSDEDHFLTQQEIIDKIDANYGIELERKSVAYSLSLLEELEYDIVKGPRGGYALSSRLFEPSEVQFITDALFSSKALPGKQAAALSKKAQSVLSQHQRKNYNYVYKSAQLRRTASKEVFYAIDTVHQGIKEGKRISFQYQTYDEHGKPTLRYQGWRYIVSPYYLVNSNGFYYLICNYREKRGPINVFRVDCLTNLQIEKDWDIKPLNSIKGMENFDIADYINEHIYLLGGEVVNAALRIDQPWGIQYLKDWFGDKAVIIETKEGLQARIRCNEDSLFFWILQYGNEFTLLKPASLVERLKKHLKEQSVKYGG